MKLGAEPKKVAVLAGILVFGAIAVYVANSDDTPESPRPAAAAPVATAPVAAAPRPGGPKTKAPDRRTVNNRGGATAWNLRMGTQNPEDRPDPATVDPALQMEKLVKVQSVELGSPGRNLFVFGAPPPPPMPANLPKVAPIPIAKNVPPPQPPPPPQPTVQMAPQAPPITLKYYGFKVSRTDGHKAAFLLDGEDILIGGENDVLKKHYRIVRINAASIVIEDTDFKTTQTLQIQETPAG